MESIYVLFWIYITKNSKPVKSNHNFAKQIKGKDDITPYWLQINGDDI